MAKQNKADKVYKALKEEGYSKEKSAKIAQAKTGQPLKGCHAKKGKR